MFGKDSFEECPLTEADIVPFLSYCFNRRRSPKIQMNFIPNCSTSPSILNSCYCLLHTLCPLIRLANSCLTVCFKVHSLDKSFGYKKFSSLMQYMAQTTMKFVYRQSFFGTGNMSLTGSIRGLNTVESSFSFDFTDDLFVSVIDLANIS